MIEFYRPVPDTFKDYIKELKPNGYQSIHIAVFGNENIPVEVQIRTQDMHFVAERGWLLILIINGLLQLSHT